MADAQALAHRPEDDLLVGDQAGKPHRMDAHASGAGPAPRPVHHRGHRAVGGKGRVGGGRPRRGHALGRPQGGARGGVELAVVVQLHDLRALEPGRGQLGEPHHQHGADGEVGRQDAVGRTLPRPGEGAGQPLEVVGGEAGGAHDGVDPLPGAERQGRP